MPNPLNSTIQAQLAHALSRHWWVLLVRGLAAIVFGVLALAMPLVSLTSLILLFGAYSLFDGIVGVWSALGTHREHDHWVALLLWGILGVVVGLLTFLAPGVTALALLFYIAIWAIATGSLQIVTAIRLRKEIEGELLLVIAGLASVAFGVLLMAQPAAGALAVVMLIGTYAVLFGLLLVLLAFKVKKCAIA